MIYQLQDGRTIDTERQLNFEERNFIQKILIYQHLKFNLEDFRAKWRRDGTPVWKGPSTLDNPTPAVQIILDVERRIKAAAGG